MKNVLYILLCISICIGGVAQASNSQDSIADAIEAERNGDHQKAILIYEAHAKNGETKSMVTIGVKYHQGEGVPQDYDLAMDWYLKAFKNSNADALNNIGVMYRDGQGVEVNRKISYILFLTIHMASLGSQDTQIRANRNLRREVDEFSPEERQAALCFTWPYVVNYVLSKGEQTQSSEDVLPSDKNIRIKDFKWWLPDEKKSMNYECASPWD